MFVQVDKRVDVLQWSRGVAESKLCSLLFIARVIVLFHFSSRRQANPSTRPSQSLPSNKSSPTSR